MSTEDRSFGWSSFKSGAIGAALVGAVGFLGNAALQVINAPRDTVAYDLIQSMTGLLRKPDADIVPPPKAIDLPEKPKPAPAEPQPEARLAPSAPPPAASPPPVASSPSSAPTVESAGQSAREAAELADRASARTRDVAVGAPRAKLLADKSVVTLCGASFGVEVYPVAKSVVLKPQTANAQYLRIGMGQQVKLGPTCRLLLKAMRAEATPLADVEETFAD